MGRRRARTLEGPSGRGEEKLAWLKRRWPAAGWERLKRRQQLIGSEVKRKLGSVLAEEILADSSRWREEEGRRTED